jgi:hypothetical protein
MLVTGIKSKPVYAPLRADTGGRYHLMLASGPGAQRGIDRLALDSFERLAAGGVSVFDGVHALLGAFRTALDESFMGTRLYVAGPESFIGLAMKIALEFDLNKDEIRAEELGTLARRVHCVHCRHASEEVRTNIVKCAGCGQWLLVRDHYSRRLAAYMGVMADAEVPGDLPPVKEVFL